jgi:regulator of sigma E protease
MDLSLLGDTGQSIVVSALAFLFVLTVVVFFHELGHFLIARWCGVRVETFSVGFGRELIGFTDRHQTRWKLGWVPLGGYVKFLGDDSVASTPDRDNTAVLNAPDSFHTKSVGRRAAIVAAGPIANFILAIVIYALLFSTFGKPITLPLVDQVQPGSAAAEAGFQPGDMVLEIDGRRIESFSDITRIVEQSAELELSILVERGGERLLLTATPQLREKVGPFGNSGRVGLLGVSSSGALDASRIQRYDPLTATWVAVKETYHIVEATLGYLGGVIAGRQSADQLGGPIRIAQISGQAASLGLLVLINLAAVLSVSIGLINLFPIPMLDGGHLMFFAFEAARGRPLSESVQDIGFRIGLGLVLMLMLFATWNDLVQLDVF